MIIDAMDLLYSKNVDGFCLVSSDSDFTRLAIRLRESGMKVIGIGEKKTPSAFIAACEKFIYLEVISPSARMLETSSTSSASSTTPASTPVAGPQTAKPRGRGRGPVVRLPLGKSPVAPAVPPAAAVPTTPAPIAASAVVPVSAAASQSVPNSPALADDRVRRDIVQLVSTAVNAVSDDNGWACLGDIGTLIAKSRPDFDPRNYGFGKLALLVAALGRFDIEYRESGQPNVKRVYIRNKG